MLSSLRKKIVTKRIKSAKQISAPPAVVQAPVQATTRKISSKKYTLACLIGTAFSLPVMAQIGPTSTTPVLTPQLDDNFHPFVSAAINYDDNLLRLSDDQRGQYDGGSDTYKTEQAGVAFNGQVGRQILTGDARVSKVSFDRFSELDYTGKDFESVLNWFVGEHLSGHAGFIYSQSLSAFTDFHSDQRNLRTKRKEYVDAAYRFHPSWQVRGGFSRESVDYELLEDNIYDVTEDITSIGIDYLASSSSRIGFQLRKVKDSYPQSQVIGNTVLDNGFVQDEAKIDILWAVTGSTQVLFLGGWVKRKHDVFTSRDDSGTNGRLIVNWAPRERVQITAAAYREFGSAEGVFINSALIKGESISATWATTAKTSIVGTLKHEKRDFAIFSDPGVLVPAGLPADAFTDSSRTATLGFNYMPVPQITLGINVFHEARSGSIAADSNSYRAKGISFNASGQF
jgi:exopolysaccharide biosynthesis operon protein EpsL